MGARRRIAENQKERPRSPDAPSLIDRLRYIADMSGELAALAGATRQPMLTYFLNMARVEAEMQIAESMTSRDPRLKNGV